MARCSSSGESSSAFPATATSPAASCPGCSFFTDLVYTKVQMSEIGTRIHTVPVLTSRLEEKLVDPWKRPDIPEEEIRRHHSSVA